GIYCRRSFRARLTRGRAGSYHRLMNPADLADRLAGFRYCQPITTRFNDFDALGHVNNAIYLTYCESARFGYWATISRNTPLPVAGFILARMELDYRRPIRWGDAD